MKRIGAWFMGILLLLSACGKNNTPASKVEPAVSPTGIISGKGEHNVPGNYEQMPQYTEAPTVEVHEESLKTLKLMVLNDATPQELLTYINNHMETAGKNEADNILLIYESIQKAWLDYFMNSFPLTSNSRDGVDQAWEEELVENGFQLRRSRESLIPIIDYDLYLNWRGKISGWFTDYLVLAKDESIAPAVQSGQRDISLEELERRLLMASTYIEKYPQSVRINRVLTYYEMYLFAYLYGYDNALVFDFRTNQVSEEYLTRYRYFVSNNPGTKAAELVSEYIRVIETGGYMLTPDVQAFLEDIFYQLNDHRIVVRTDLGTQIMVERIGRLLPGKIGYTWRCFGFAEYGHKIKLESIHTEDSNPVYTLIGTVDDVSDGEISSELLTVFLQYRIHMNTLSQFKIAPVLMDTDFNELEIIRYPFIVGHRWFQYAYDENYNLCSIETEIIGKYIEDGITLYEVEYRNLSTGGNEKRLIQTGEGTIAFTKLYMESSLEPFEVGYTIYWELSGYGKP